MTTAVPQRPEAPVVARGFGALRAPVLAVAGGAGRDHAARGRRPEPAGSLPDVPVPRRHRLYCPGCGSLRALHDLAHGDLGGALAAQPTHGGRRGRPGHRLGPVGTAAVAWPAATLGRPPALLYGLLTLVLAFWALRNVPGWTWLSPA